MFLGEILTPEIHFRIESDHTGCSGTEIGSLPHRAK